MIEKRIVATFHPQEWIENYAVDVQPDGAQTFDVTDIIEAMGKSDALSIQDNSDESDTLARSACAPKWIREWSGPG
jgi:hypothetical protein